MLFTAQNCSILRTGIIITQIPRGYQKKSLFCRKARYVRSLGKNPPFWPSQRLRKVLFTAQGCARLRTGLKITQISRGYQKKSLLCRKARYVRSLAKKSHFCPSQRLKKVSFTAQGCARLRTGLMITQIPRGYQKKKFIVSKRAICAILSEKSPFLAFLEAKKVLFTAQGCARLRTGLKITQIPLGLSEKKVYCVEKRDMCDP